MFFGVTYHLIYLTHVLKTFKCDRDKYMLTVRRKTAPRTATHSSSAAAHSRLAGSLDPPARSLPMDQYSTSPHRGSHRGHVYCFQCSSVINDKLIHEQRLTAVKPLQGITSVPYTISTPDMVKTLE